MVVRLPLCPFLRPPLAPPPPNMAAARPAPRPRWRPGARHQDSNAFRIQIIVLKPALRRTAHDESRFPVKKNTKKLLKIAKNAKN